MQTRNHNTFTTIHTEGALLPVDLLQRISGNDKNLEGLLPESYHLAPGEKLTETINRSWNRLYGLWGAFQAARSQLRSSDMGTTLTRERWLLPLFQELGFGRLSTSKAVEIEGKSYPISHAWQNIPLHLVGCGIDLDKRTPGAAGAARTSPHSLLQEYLNQSEAAQWGVVSNGLRLRVLRDNATLTRQAYIEFDLEAMFDGEVYSDFTLLWLICHQSRFETSAQQSECILEGWSKSAQAIGTRALDDLRRGVEKAIVNLGQGFLQHPLNSELRCKLKQGDLTSQDYYRQLLRLVYRLIFLFVSEDRDLLLLPDATVEARWRFQQYYSTAHLRSMAEKLRGSRHHDRYEALRQVISLLGSDSGCPELALPALGGFLFGAESIADMNEAKLDNRSLLAAVRSLAFITEGNVRRGVDYRNLGPEELGSVYESLLELHPLLNTDAGTFELTSAAGNERKTTGSYYTPSSLIRVLLDSALDPVLEDRMKSQRDASQKEEAILALKVCDPACGSGHFLIAAAHRIARKLAEVRSGGDEPSPNETRRALRDVIRHCIYGVDINPMAVELCKVNLWLESLEPGKPLSFLDAHIKCGNSLVGMGPEMRIDELEVPDEAFNPVTGDHKTTAALLKKRNKAERPGQENLFVTVLKTKNDLESWLAEHERMLEAMPEDNAVEVLAKVEAYQKVNESAQFRKQRQIADLWAAAFFWKIEESKGTTYEIIAPTQTQLRRLRSGQDVQMGLLEKVAELGLENEFFHWPLEFAEVAAQGGFDSVLGNPPWERIKLQEQEFFAARDPEIANAQNKAARDRMIRSLDETNPPLAQAFKDAKHGAECSSKFARNSVRFPFSAVGDMNTYALFTEHFRRLISSQGRAGLIVPTGIATDDTLKDFFRDLTTTNSLSRLIGFENEEFLFSGIANVIRFCILSLQPKTLVPTDATYVYYLRQVNQMHQHERLFSLSASDLALLNPNTYTSPIFRTKVDATLTKAIYKRIPVLINENTNTNIWGVRYAGLFHMANDSDLFHENPGKGLLPLYEGKFFWHFDHRFGSYGIEGPGRGGRGLTVMPISNYENPNFSVVPRYWLKESDVELRLQGWKYKWLICFRSVTSAKLERTVVFSFIPRVAIGHNAPLLFPDKSPSFMHTSCLLANMNSLIFDFLARQKIGGTSLGNFILNQLPVLLPNTYSSIDLEYISSRVLPLVYTAYDLTFLANDLGYSGQPIIWDESRREILRAELDAYYARLYGLNRKQLRYVLDPADLTQPELEDILDPWEEVSDPLDPQGYAQRAVASDFPGETFRVLKEKENRQFGEYRTRRLVLEAWERLKDVEIHSASVDTETIPIQPITTPLQDAYSSINVDDEDEHPDNSFSSPTPISQQESPSELTQMDWTDFSLYKCLACGKITTGFDIPNHEQEVHQSMHVEWKKIK